ncbi:MAG TPA: SDR family oxidoreductase [Bacillota bacterium]|nr:SDR family oxidoreductase [Bacillota bacterium]HPU95798.1 SDR family oxidoreductase [Bacillota bacterium]
MKDSSKVILVTGATSGFGKAAALYLAGLGHKVYGFGRSVESTTREAGGNLTMMRMDVNDSSSVNDAISAVLAAEGRIDVMLAAAGLGLGGSVEDVTIAEAKALFETNVFGAMRTVKAVAPVMRGQKSGLIIFVSSIGGLIGLPFQGLYSSTKFAVEGLAEAMSMELRPFGVDVVIAEPGDFATGFTANRVKAVASESADSGYKEAYKRAMRNIEKDENSGYKPDVFAIAISRIINSRRRKLRYMIGSPLQKSSVFIKKVLPSRLFERIMAWYYTGSR